MSFISFWRQNCKTSQRPCLPELFQWQVNFNTKFGGASKPQQRCRLCAQHIYAGLLQKTVENKREVRLLFISISPHPVSEQIPDRCHGKNNLMQTPAVFIHWLGKGLLDLQTRCHTWVLEQIESQADPVIVSTCGTFSPLVFGFLEGGEVYRHSETWRSH